jgi:hypothetical protein
MIYELPIMSDSTNSSLDTISLGPHEATRSSIEQPKSLPIARSRDARPGSARLSRKKQKERQKRMKASAKARDIDVSVYKSQDSSIGGNRNRKKNSKYTTKKRRTKSNRR